MRKILAVVMLGFLLLPVSAFSADPDPGSGPGSQEVGDPDPGSGPQAEPENSGDDTMRISNTHNSGFEGIWQLNSLGENWVGVTVSGGKIILLKYQPGQLSSALAGSIVGGAASLGFATDASSFAATFTLTSSTTATLAVSSCVPKPGLSCSFPSGSNFGLTKVFE